MLHSSPFESSVYWFKQQRSQGEPLRGSISSEVVVVGGGIAGLTCAQALIERGVEVTLLEQAFCGAGASGKSSGFITPDSELDLTDLVANYGEARGQVLWEFAKSGLERIRRTIQTLAIDCDYQVQDSLFVARSGPAVRDVIEAEHRTHAAHGYHSTVYDRASLQAILGSGIYQGGIRYPGTFGMNSYAYCRALRDALERRGVRIFEGTPVTRLTETGVETPGGAVSARRIAVLTDYELPALGLAVPVVSHVRTFLSASRPLLPWAAALGEYVAQKMTDGRAELDDLLSPGRSFRLGSLVQRLLGKRAAFALSHGMAKMR